MENRNFKWSSVKNVCRKKELKEIKVLEEKAI